MLKSILIAFLLVISSNVFSAPILIAMDSDFAPYTYVDEKGNLAGFYYEIVVKMMETNKVDYKINAYPWARVLASTDNNSIDLSIPWRSKPERFEKYHMVGPFTNMGSSYYLFKKKDSPISWKTMADLKGKKVGVVRGFSYPGDFEKDSGMLKESLNDTATLVRMLIAGRVDLIISEEVVLNAELKKQGKLKSIERSGKAIETTDRYMVIPKEKIAIAAKIKDMFTKFKETKEYKSIVDKYVLH